MDLSQRVLLYLERQEKAEIDPWKRDDLRIAWITVSWAWLGVPDWSWHRTSPPHIAATYQVLHCHPDEVWPRIQERRRAQLGSEYARWHPESIDIPQTKKQPMAESRGGFAPPKTCAYGAGFDQPTGASCSTVTKREARRALTSEFGLTGEPPAGVAAPAVKKPCASERRGTRRKEAA